MHQNSTIKDRAHKALELQILALTSLDKQFSDGFEKAVEILTEATFVITCGLGKSGFIAKKMAATLTSVQCSSVYLHPVDALHGDSGLMSIANAVVVFSKSGETPELVRFINSTRTFRLPVISICAREGSSIGNLADVSLIAGYEQELDTDNILPTASTTSALVLADILSVIVAQERGAGIQHLQQTHPQGSIGSGLMRTVEECMHSGKDVPVVGKDASVLDAMVQLTSKPLGVVCVVNEGNRLLGILTDGDVRRLAMQQVNFVTTSVASVMITSPTTIEAHESLRAALQLMEQPQRQLSVLPVVHNNICVGVLRLHDVVRLPNV